MPVADPGALSSTGVSFVSPAAELLCRGQFVLGPAGSDAFPGWTRRPLPGGFSLTAHPALPVASVSQDSRALVLIGFMLDPAAPTAGDDAILARLLPSCSSIQRLIESTATLGGRWSMVAACDDGLFLFTDALGLRQVLFTEPAGGHGLWAMSQAGLAFDALGLPADEDAAQFVDSYSVRARAEYRWPGTGTPVRGLRHLLPNHALDLRTGSIRRYWPDRPLSRLSLVDAVDLSIALVSGMIQAAANRFELALALTAGVDSRLVLAAARPVKDRICYVTVRQAKMADTSDDLTIPARLLNKLGLQHEIVRAAGSMSAGFSWAYKRSVYLAHDHYGPDAEAILTRFGRRKVAMTGSGGEVGRCSFRHQLPFSRLRRIRAEDLARLQYMVHPYAVRFFQEWLADVGGNADVNLLDLFEWEQGHGNWLAMTQLEFDIAWRDIFTPYNCRALLTAFLSVSERYRRAPDYTLFNLITRKLWREVLSEPVNPRGRPSMLRRSVGLLRGLRLSARAA